MSATRRFAALLIWGSFLLGSCTRIEDARSGGGVQAEDSATGGLETGPNGEPEARPQPEELPARIYYDLTRYQWYAQGEPLRHGGGVYSPRGTPVRVATSALSKVGDYQGVDIYVARDATENPDVVYVPVFEGFWLRFVRDPVSASG